jgi:hypothetical protein
MRTLSRRVIKFRPRLLPHCKVPVVVFVDPIHASVQFVEGRNLLGTFGSWAKSIDPIAKLGDERQFLESSLGNQIIVERNYGV